MKSAEFEEKEYEVPLYQELLGSPIGNLWSPGQVFEEHFGIDAALNVNNPLFWRIVGYSAPPRGAILDNYTWGKVWTAMERIKKSATPSKRPLPHFKVNLLLQVKRPEFLKGTNSDLLRQGIFSSYWRFKITPHQQAALEYISSRLSNRALVAYGCPAFHSLRDLYYHIENKSLVRTSSFVRALKLSGHKAWNYDSPGMIGVACSEMERVDEGNIFEKIKELIHGIVSHEHSEKEQPETPAGNLSDLSHALIAAMKELSEKESPIGMEFMKRFKRGMEEIGSKELGHEVTDFSIIAGLFEFMGLSWLVAA